MGRRRRWRALGAVALGAGLVPVVASSAEAGEQEVVRPVTFTFGGDEVTCSSRHWDFRRSSGGQTTLQVGTELLDANPDACFDAVRHTEVTITYRREDGSAGYATAGSPGGEITAGVVELGTLTDVLVRHGITFACDGERCNAGDYVVTTPK